MRLGSLAPRRMWPPCALARPRRAWRCACPKCRWRRGPGCSNWPPPMAFIGPRRSPPKRWARRETRASWPMSICWLPTATRLPPWQVSLPSARPRRSSEPPSRRPGRRAHRLRYPSPPAERGVGRGMAAGSAMRRPTESPSSEPPGRGMRIWAVSWWAWRPGLAWPRRKSWAPWLPPCR